MFDLQAQPGLYFVWATLLPLASFVVLLIVYFLRRRAESVREVMLGTAPRWREAGLGLALVVPVTIGVALLVAAVRVVWPALRNVPISDLAALADFAASEKIGLTVVGPEAPLAAGVVENAGSDAKRSCSSQ